jgi:hypothetical protein
MIGERTNRELRIKDKLNIAINPTGAELEN